MNNHKPIIRPQVWISILISVVLATWIGWQFRHKPTVPEPPALPEKAIATNWVVPATNTPLVVTENATDTNDPKTPGYLRYLRDHNPNAFLAYLEARELENQGPVNFYARLVDQNNQPVPDAEFDFSLRYYDPQNLRVTNRQGDVDPLLQRKNFIRKTDGEGMVAVTGMAGTHLDIQGISKAGYVIDLLTSQSFAYGKNLERHLAPYWDPATPRIFKAWKSEGHSAALLPVKAVIRYRPMTGDEQFVRWYVNLITGRVSEQRFSNADLVVTMSLVKPGNGMEDYGLLEVQTLNGSIATTDHVKTFLAPVALSGNIWKLRIDAAYLSHNETVGRQNVYAKIRSGKIWFGGEIDAHYMHMMTIQGYINPEGSVNLEPDPDKLITNPEEIRRIDEATQTK